MSNLKISSELFLGSPELKRLQKFLDADGFRKNILDNSVSFGLIKNDLDPSFANAKIIPDADLVIGGTTFKTFRHNVIAAIDKFGNFIQKDAETQFPIPNTGLWYWVRISYQISNQEKGTWSIDANGNLTGTGGELLSILRGKPNFPSKVRFVNATSNILDYDILSVTDDNNAVLNGVTFQAESNLKLEVVGTFTYGQPIDPANKLIFNYDSCLVELVPEDVGSINVRPTAGFQDDVTFYIARVKVDGGQVLVQDKRNDQWETKASFQNKDIDIISSPLIGVENVKYNHPFTPLDRNIVEVAWNFRSQNWTINSTTNTITLSSGLGGKFKTVDDFTSGDFNGWRIYAPNGTYSKIISSAKVGNAINLQVDLLDVDNFSNDGGVTFITTEYLIVTPNAEEIEVSFIPNAADNIPTEIQRFAFQINEQIGRCEVLAFKSPTSSYVVTYRYKSDANYSPTRLLPNDAVGYYNESSFDVNQNLLIPGQTTRVPYTSSSTVGFIILTLNPKAYANFQNKVDKGDLFGVRVINDLTGLTNINLIVGTSLNYLLFTGDLQMPNDINIQLFTTPLVNGNEFRIQFNCDSFDLNGHTLNITINNGSGFTVVKTFTVGDFYQMKNIQNGIVIDAVADGTTWYLSQQYDLGLPGEFKDINGNPNTLFDANGNGQVRGLYGYGLADGRFGRPDRRGLFTVGLDLTDPDYSTLGATGGLKKNNLVEAQLAPHKHVWKRPRMDIIGPQFQPNRADDGNGTGLYEGDNQDTTTVGSGADIENRPPYFTAVIAVKLF
jgi:hypothetical protein